MRNTLVLILILSISCTQPDTKKISDPIVLNQLDSLVEMQDFFKLRESFLRQEEKLSKEHSLYYKAITLNVFNNLSESNARIDSLIQLKFKHLSDSVINKIYKTKLLNHINLYQYEKAKTTSEHILKNYHQLNDSSDIEMLENELNIWKSLENVPAQQIFKNEDASFPMATDKVGLFNIDVSMNNTTANFIFDTGANISVIKKSLVDELGLTYIESDFFVTAFTGKKVDSDLAVADELMIGDLVFKNVVFLVLNDEDVSFPQIDYYINGIIGFPVIEAMEEIRISKDNTIFTPKIPVDYNQGNFALDGLTPIIAVRYKGDTLSFGFDTGARSTSLYAPFYRKYEKEVENNYAEQTFESGSAGGTAAFQGYLLDSISLTIGPSKAKLENVQLHKENIKADINNFYGNLGQDFIKQFDEMIVSFKYGSVVFK